MKFDASIAKRAGECACRTQLLRSRQVAGARDVPDRSAPDRGCPQPQRFRKLTETRTSEGLTAIGLLRLGTAAVRLVLGFAMLFLPQQLVAADAPPPMSPYEARAILVFKIAQFTEWPRESFESDNAPFVLGILGDDPSKPDFSKIDGKTIKGRHLVVKHLSDPQEAAKCHLLFISSSEESRVPKILKGLENTSVMTVAEMSTFIERDGIVNLGQTLIKPGMANLHFEINRAAAEKAKLKINSQLLSLASKK